MFARRSRVSALISLAKRGPPILWAMLQNESEWCLQAREDLQWLVGGEEDQWPALSGAAWPTWWHILRDQPQRVKRRAHRRNLQDFRGYKEKAATEICLWYMYRQLPDEILPASQGITWVCRVCDKVFQKRSALSGHFFKTHGRCASTASTSAVRNAVAAKRSSGRKDDWRTTSGRRASASGFSEGRGSHSLKRCRGTAARSGGEMRRTTTRLPRPPQDGHRMLLRREKPHGIGGSVSFTKICAMSYCLALMRRSRTYSLGLKGRCAASPCSRRRSKLR